MIGASGTLGIVTEAVLKVTALPENVHVAVIPFPSTHQAVSTVVHFAKQGVPIAAMELLDETIMEAVNDSGYTDSQWRETPTLFMKFSGSEETVKQQLKLVQEVAEKNGAEAFESSKDAEEIEGLWSARKTALWSFLATKRHPDDKFMACDVAVPISRLADIVEDTKRRIKESGLHGHTLGHVGDGIHSVSSTVTHNK